MSVSARNWVERKPLISQWKNSYFEREANWYRVVAISTPRKEASADMSADEKPAPTRRHLVAMVLVLLLSLGTWAFFYLKAVPLAATDTAVVVGFWLIVVFGAKWLWGRFAGKRNEGPSS